MDRPHVPVSSTVTVRLFARKGQPAAVVEVEGSLPQADALRQALKAIVRYLRRLTATAQ
jgi:hypothetical protein